MEKEEAGEPRSCNFYILTDRTQEREKIANGENEKYLAKVLSAHLCWANNFHRKALTSSFVSMVIELSSKPLFLSILLNALRCH